MMRAMERPICATSMVLGEPRSEMVALVIDEHLRLVHELSKGHRVQDSVAVALERVRSSGVRSLSRSSST